MKLDKVLTIAVGRDTAHGTLKLSAWISFRRELRQLLNEYTTVVADTHGAGIASDDEREGKPEDTAVFVAINPHHVTELRGKLAHLLLGYGQSSACFALDVSHEPAFATNNGYRLSVA